MFAPVVPREKAKRSALRHLVETFFDGSAEQAAVALLDSFEVRLKPEELERLMRLVRKAEEDGAPG